MRRVKIKPVTVVRFETSQRIKLATEIAEDIWKKEIEAE